MHALRHYYASALLAGGVDIRALSEYLGHHDPAFTLRIYAKARELHQLREKPQVSRSRPRRNSVLCLRAAAV